MQNLSPDEKAAAIQSQDIPAFLAALEQKYGKTYLADKLAFGVIIRETASSNFLSTNTGNYNNSMCVAHSTIRNLATREIQNRADAGLPKLEEHEAVWIVMQLLFQGIMGDIGRTGVPDAIFEGYMKNRP